MSTAIIHKKTAISGRSPTTSQLEYGELAINTVDGKVFFKYDPGSGAVLATLLEVTEDNLAVDPSGLGNSSSTTLAGVLNDLDGAITSAVSGGLTSVASDSTLSGNGTSGSPLSVTIGLNNLSDVDIATTAPTTGQVLKWNGTNFVPADDTDTQLALSGASVGDLGDVDITTTAPTSGQVLKWNGTAFVPADDIDTTLTFGSIDQHTDVDTSTTAPTDGQVLTWVNANSAWEPADAAATYTDSDADARIAAASIGDLSDVDTTTAAPISGQALVWDGSKWEPGTISGSGNVSYAEQNIVSDTYTGDGTTVDFNTSLLPNSEDHVLVSLNGIVQDPSTYSLFSNTITFATAPSNGDNVELRTFEGFTADVQMNNYFSYVFTTTADVTSITGNDDNSNTLDYTPNRLEVYVNGVRLVNGSDYTATNGTSISFNETVFDGSVIEVVSLASATLFSQGAFEITSSSQPLTTTVANQVVALFDKTVYRTAKFFVQMSHASAGYHATEVLVVHDGTNAYWTEYGTIFSILSLGDISVGINGDNVELRVTPVNTSTTVKAKRISVEV